VQDVLASGADYEVRTTIHPSWLDDPALLRLARDLAGRGVRHYALQLARSEESSASPIADTYPAPDTLAELASLFDRFELRGG
jgi:pyruvate formate lyase activating enzyme